jgi:glucose-1-phosphate cytidylyltransferase
MSSYAHHGFNEFVLCLGYKGAVIKEYFLNYDSMHKDFTISFGERSHPDITFHDHEEASDFKVTLADTGMNTMTGGRLKRVERHVDTDTFMVTYGDAVSDVNLRELVAFHRRHRRLATVTAVRPESRFGLLELGVDDEVLRFREKPQLDEWISGGFFVFDRRVFDYLDPDCVLEQEPLMNLAADGQLVAYRHTGFWHAMDTYRDTLHLNELWDEEEAPWAVWRNVPPGCSLNGGCHGEVEADRPSRGVKGSPTRRRTPPSSPCGPSIRPASITSL